MAKSFDNRVAVVTGGGSGIGRASALTFVREGAKVVVSDVDAKGGEETVRMIKKAGGEAIFVKTDVSKANDVEAMVDKAIEVYGRLDYAHNNAGVLPSLHLIADMPEKDWDRVLSINLKGMFLCIKYEVPQMLKHGKGAIVNTSSINGLIAMPRTSDYTAGKHGLLGLTKAAALDYATQGIRVNAICPGAILTPMMTTLAPDSQSQAGEAEKQPIGRLGTPEEIAEAAVWLCSDAASFVTGACMSVDGGRVAW